MISTADRSGYLYDSASSLCQNGKSLPFVFTTLGKSLRFDFICENNMPYRELLKYGSIPFSEFRLDAVSRIQRAGSSFCLTRSVR